MVVGSGSGSGSGGLGMVTGPGSVAGRAALIESGAVVGSEAGVGVGITSPLPEHAEMTAVAPSTPATTAFRFLT
jgi:hypothetical protein